MEALIAEFSYVYVDCMDLSLQRLQRWRLGNRPLAQVCSFDQPTRYLVVDTMVFTFSGYKGTQPRSGIEYELCSVRLSM